MAPDGFLDWALFPLVLRQYTVDKDILYNQLSIVCSSFSPRMMLHFQSFFLHGNAPVQTTKASKDALNSLGFDIVHSLFQSTFSMR